MIHIGVPSHRDKHAFVKHLTALFVEHVLPIIANAAMEMAHAKLFEEDKPEKKKDQADE